MVLPTSSPRVTSPSASVTPHAPPSLAPASASPAPLSRPSTSGDKYVRPRSVAPAAAAATPPASYAATHFGDLRKLDTKDLAPNEDARALPGRMDRAMAALERRDYQAAQAELEAIHDGSYKLKGSSFEERSRDGTAVGVSTSARHGAQRFVTLKQQTDVLVELEKATGKKPEHPPSLSDLRTYFRTLRGKDPATVAGAWDRYAHAFHKHNGTEAIRTDRGTPASALPPEAPIATPQTKGHGEAAGKTLNDCTGFMALGGALFREAGYDVSYVGVRGVRKRDGGVSYHGMAVCTRRDHATAVVVSNTKTYLGSKSALRRGAPDSPIDTAAHHIYRSFDRVDATTVNGAAVKLGELER